MVVFLRLEKSTYGARNSVGDEFELSFKFGENPGTPAKNLRFLQHNYGRHSRRKSLFLAQSGPTDRSFGLLKRSTIGQFERQEFRILLIEMGLPGRSNPFLSFG